MSAETRRKEPSYTCNGCGDFDMETKKWTHGKHGAGKRAKWPTGWAHYKGDIMQVQDIRDDLTCYTLIIKNLLWQEKAWNGEDFIVTGFNGLAASKLKQFSITSGSLVTVDYHC